MASDRQPGHGWFFDDFASGQRFESPAITVTESSIIDFAAQYDPQPFHLDVVTAGYSPYGGLIASGFQTLALGFRMFLQLGLIAGCSLGSPGIDEVRWLRPVRPGDTLRTIAEVLSTAPSRSTPGRGTVTWAFQITNQNDEVVATFRDVMLLARRPLAPAG
jgi:acyl dehydratase